MICIFKTKAWSTLPVVNCVAVDTVVTSNVLADLEVAGVVRVVVYLVSMVEGIDDTVSVVAERVVVVAMEVDGISVDQLVVVVEILGVVVIAVDGISGVVDAAVVGVVDTIVVAAVVVGRGATEEDKHRPQF